MVQESSDTSIAVRFSWGKNNWSISVEGNNGGVISMRDLTACGKMLLDTDILHSALSSIMKSWSLVSLQCECDGFSLSAVYGL